MTRVVWAAAALAVLAGALLCAVSHAAAPPATLVLEHADLVTRARHDAPGVAITYTATRVVIRGRVSFALMWWPIRITARFVRDGARVRLACDELRVRGRLMRSRREQADGRLARLVDVETAARRVEIRREGRVVYAQEVEP